MFCIPKSRGVVSVDGPGPVGDGGRVGVEEQVLELPGVAVEADGTAAVAQRAARVRGRPGGAVARARGWWRVCM